jgi:hypothetical protein
MGLRTSDGRQVGNRRLVVRTPLLVTATTVLALACSVSPAFAAAPEAPVTEPATAVTATTATLNGELNPNASGTAGYLFDYNTNGTCSEGPATPQEPEATGEAIRVSAPVTGLEPSREYTFCIAATHLEGETTETASGEPVGFKTAAAPPAVDGESASAVAAFSATLEAQVNPNNQETTVSFEYSTQATGETLEGTVATVPAATLGAEFGDRGVAAPTGPVLQAGTTYFYRTVAENLAAEKTEGEVKSFTSPGTPLVGPVEASKITRTTATIAGEVDAHGAITEYFLEYGQAEAHGTPGSPTPVVTIAAAHPGAQQIVPIALEELTPGTTYHYRLVAVNEAGATRGPEGTFTTAAAQPPDAITGDAAEVTQTAATIAGTLNPNGLPTTYAFEVGSEIVNGVPAYNTPTYAEAGSEASSAPVRLALVGLAPGITYHYRLVGTNADGTSTGADRTFTTPEYPSRLVEPVTPTLLASTLFPATPTGGTVKPKQPTRAQKLARALHACHAKHGKRRRRCEAAARRAFGPVKRKG